MGQILAQSKILLLNLLIGPALEIKSRHQQNFLWKFFRPLRKKGNNFDQEDEDVPIFKLRIAFASNIKMGCV